VKANDRSSETTDPGIGRSRNQRLGYQESGPFPVDDPPRHGLAVAHDPVEWEFVLGRFDRERWRKNWQDIFDSHDLIHNRRHTVKIQVSAEQDASFAVVDIDTLWRHKETEEDSHWQGRVCKIYTKMSSGEWKMIFQTGALDFSKITG
jgi:hypothetical protein